MMARRIENICRNRALMRRIIILLTSATCAIGANAAVAPQNDPSGRTREIIQQLQKNADVNGEVVALNDRSERTREIIQLLEKDVEADVSSKDTSAGKGALVPEKTRAAVTSETVEAYNQALQAAYARDKWAAEFKQRIYEWQFVSSKIVFGMVIFLVLTGVYFSWLQFKVSAELSKPRPRTVKTTPRAQLQEAAANEPGAGPDGDEDEAPRQAAPGVVTEIEASVSGFKISTPILGVVILALSFLFFYLYLEVVYPIN